jgi:gamma-glutamyltranspeptidase / glutathione hydrolase
MKKVIRIFFKVLMWLGISLVGLIALFYIVYAFYPKGPRDMMTWSDLEQTPRILVTAQKEAAVTGTPWATEAAMSILKKGGNAYDASVAALLVLNVTNGVHSSFPCEAPVMIYNAADGSVHSYIGAGKAPAAATLESFQAKGWKTIPGTNIWAQLVPASPDVMVALLKDYGSMSFAEVSAPAIQIAREGFPATRVLLVDMGKFTAIGRFAYQVVWPTNGNYFFQHEWWRPLRVGDRTMYPDLANTFQRMADAETAVTSAGGSRLDGLQAVRDLFYKGDIAQEITTWETQKNGLITADDLANYSSGWETPISGSYKNYTFYTNNGWTQGAVGPMALQILEGIDLKSMGHNSPEYIHAVVQAIELAMADRDAYIGDPAFVDVPWNVLLSKDFATQRREKMTGTAFGPLPAPGVVTTSTGEVVLPGTDTIQAASLENNPPGITIGQDTTQLAVRDSAGNVVVITPSDFPWTPMVPNSGINLGNRMNQFRLDPNSPDVLAAGKRPRITPHAMIVFKDGKFYMGFSTPGGDMQSQALVQVFLNMEVFGMNVQDAISAPRFYTISAPSSFAPNDANPGTIRLENDLYDTVAIGLETLGYKLQKDPKWDMDYGGVGAIVLRPDGGMDVGADPRWETWAMGD